MDATDAMQNTATRHRKTLFVTATRQVVYKEPHLSLSV